MFTSGNILNMFTTETKTQTDSTMKMVTYDEAVETFVSRFGKERFRKNQEFLKTYVDNLFEALKNGEWLKYWGEAYDLGAETLCEAIGFNLVLHNKDDKPLFEAFVNEEPDVNWYLTHVVSEAVNRLAQKIAVYLEEKIGLPQGSLAYRYNIHAMTGGYDEIPEYFDMLEFVLNFPKNMDKGDKIGDLVVENTKINNSPVPQQDCDDLKDEDYEKYWIENVNGVRWVVLHNEKTGLKLRLHRYSDNFIRIPFKNVKDDTVLLAFSEPTTTELISTVLQSQVAQV